MNVVIFFRFFFQAEDGIRDHCVTGVQTCALPISQDFPFTPEIPRQVGEARAEWKILRELAAASYPERAPLLGCETGWAMREEMARVVPFYNGVQNLKKTRDAIQYGGSHPFADRRILNTDRQGHVLR